MRASRAPAHSGGMDIVAIGLGLIVFAAMYLLLEGLERI